MFADRKRLNLVGRDQAIDFGNYKPGYLWTLNGVLGAAREMGDGDVVELALHALEEMVGRVERDGVVHFKGSNYANLMVMESHLGFTKGWREAICTPPPASVLQGPILADASYPEVLVARAVSKGEDLDLLLHPGRSPGSEQTLSVERLKPGCRYRLDGAIDSVATADALGRISIKVRLLGPTPVRILPNSD